MTLRYLLDTNICIYIAKHHPPAVRQRFAKLSPGEVGMSLITYGELRYGAERSVRREQSLNTLEQLCEWIPVCELHGDVGERYGVLRAHLQSRGEMIGNNDLWIAAHAMALGVVLVSNNTREFERVPSLLLENWAD